MPDPTDEQLLAFEAADRPGRAGGAKEERIRTHLGITPARYFQLLGRLIWTEDALRIDPMLTGRLRRLSMDRQTARAHRHNTH